MGWLVALALAAFVLWVWNIARRSRLASTMREIDAMSGQEFEHFLVRLFSRLGFEAQHVGGSGDFGADLIVRKDGVSVAVQAKNYSSGNSVGNDAVQQAIAGATYHGCDQAMVVTNSRFTRAAREQARGSSLPVSLWGRAELQRSLTGRARGTR